MKTKILVASLSLLALGSVPASAQLLVYKMLPASMALEASEAAIESCKKAGYPVVVTIVDRYGILRSMIMADNARFNLVENSRKKAFTAAVRRLSTFDYAKQMKDQGREIPRDDPNLTGGGGGLPFVVDGDTIGGIGVAGTPTGEGDEACAKAGIDKIKDRMK